MTGEQRHTDHIENGQRVSRHSLPTILYFLFSPPAFFLIQFYYLPANGTLAFAPTAQANPSGKIQRAVFCQPATTNFSYINLPLRTEFYDRT